MPSRTIATLILSLAAVGLYADDLHRIDPWTPVTVTTDSGGTEVRVWGRSHRFSERALPSSIMSAGRELLAAPVRLVGQVDGKPIVWKRGGHFLFQADANRAIISGWQAGDELIVNTTTRVEFDGVVRIDLVLMPQRKMSPKVGALWLEVPLKRENATLYHFWPGQWGAARNSGEVPAEGLNLPFKPFVWLGWEDGGLGWFAESDKGWQPADPKQPINVAISGDQAILRVHLLDSTPPRLPLTYAFGLQASPVKPFARDFHEWRVCHGAAFGLGDKPASGPSPKSALDRAADLGVRTLVFHEHWTPYQNHPLTTHEAALKSLVAACHERKVKLLLYHGYEFSSLAPEWGEMADECVVKTAAGAYSGGYFRTPEQRDYIVCYNSRYSDFLLNGVGSSLERYGYDGVYLDGTIEPWACANERHGCGYRAPDGTLKSTYPIFAVRRLMHGLAARIHPRGGFVNAHQSTCCVTPTLAYADSYWDGEQFGSGELSKDILQQLPLATFRAEFMGRNFGVPAEYLVYEKPPGWTFDAALAFTMLHDVRVRPGNTGEPLVKMSKIWNAMSEFDVARAEWHPYWEKPPVAAVSPEPVKLSLYLHRSDGQKPARCLLVVSNLSADQPTTAQVDIRSIAKGAGRASDALTGEALPCAEGRISVPLQPMRMRMVLLE